MKKPKKDSAAAIVRDLAKARPANQPEGVFDANALDAKALAGFQRRARALRRASKAKGRKA